MTCETLPGKGVTTVSGPGKAQRRGRARAESAPRDVRRGSDLAISHHAPYLQLGADNDAWDSCPGPTWKLFKVASGAIEALEMGRESHRRDCAESQEETASAPAGFLTRSSEPAASQGVGARPTRPDSIPREIPEDRQPSRRPRSCRTPDLWCPGLLPSHGNAMASLSPSTDHCDQFGGVGGEANRELSVDPIQAKKIICSSAEVRPPPLSTPRPESYCIGTRKDAAQSSQAAIAEEIGLGDDGRETRSNFQTWVRRASLSQGLRSAGV